MDKHILIVDDEEGVVFFLAENLTELRPGYQVETARSAEEALAQIETRPFDLVVTDLRMPGLDGLDLMEQIRQRQPHTRLVLMTAYGSSRIEATAYRLGACQYITKPFQIEELIATVDTALAEPRTPGRGILMLADAEFEAIVQSLSDLRFEVGAQCILLADVAGQMVAHVGEIESLDLPALVSLIGGGFATAFEMARYLGESQATTLNYHEGRLYDVYSANVDESLFVVLMFDRRKQRSRVGMVWLYTRRTLKQLRASVSRVRRVETGQALDADFGAKLSDSLDQLLVADVEPVSQAGKSPAPGTGAGWGELETADGDDDLTLQQVTALLQETPPDPAAAVPPKKPAASVAPAAQTFDLQQALKLGLVDPSWMADTET